LLDITLNALVALHPIKMTLLPANLLGGGPGPSKLCCRIRANTSHRLGGLEFMDVRRQSHVKVRLQLSRQIHELLPGTLAVELRLVDLWKIKNDLLLYILPGRDN
jgi:hypothetical protein